ncbi:MAG: BamA/TamA family outer membrane protein [Nitrospirae bacterium]|nr:BamA/TamA family outer membrane protein [Nitrospirota bacterium]
MLIYWVGILAIQALLVVPVPADAAEVYGPPNARPLVASTQEKENGVGVPMKDPFEDSSHPAEHVLKSLPVKPDYTVIPLPAFGTNKNEGAWFGGLVPILKADSTGDVKEMFVPQYLHNDKVGHYGSLNYFGYPSDTEQYHALVWAGERLDQGVDLGYKNVSVGNGRFIFAADLSVFKNPFARFFGFGSRTPERDETNYTSREFLAKLTAGINLTEDFALLWIERYRNVRVDDGIVGSLPRTAGKYPLVPGMQGAQILGHGLALRYDTRDSQLMTSKGTYVNLLAEFAQNVEERGNNDWVHTVLDARHYMPHVSDQMVFVSRVFINGVFGQIEDAGSRTKGVPFYEQSTLGGEDSLRAFGRGRYIGSWAALVNLEERVTVLSKRLFGLDTHLEVAPFLDMGRVGQSTVKAKNLVGRNLEYNPGVGFRLLVKPTVVGRADVAYGRDGANVFVGLDYPF